MCDAKKSAATIEPGRLERGSGAGGIASEALGGLGEQSSEEVDQIESFFFSSKVQARPPPEKIEHVAAGSLASLFVFPLSLSVLLLFARLCASFCCSRTLPNPWLLSALVAECNKTRHRGQRALGPALASLWVLLQSQN